jgi:HK97 family phage major capsid protein
MSKALLDRLMSERTEVTEYVTRTLEGVEGGRDLSDAETRTVNDAKARIESIDAQIRPLADFMATRDAAVDVTALLARGEHRARQAAQAEAGPAPVSLSSFVDSDQFRTWGGRGRSDRFDLDGFQARAGATHILETGADPGKILLPNSQKVVLSAPEKPRPLLSALGYLPVTTGAVDMVFYGSPEGAKTLAEVPEKTAKPEVQIEATTAPVVLPTIAGWVAATRQLLEDAPAARGLIDGQLRRGYYTALEKAAATSIGAGTYAKITGAAGVSLLAVARQAQADLQANGYEPGVMLTSPADAAAMDIALMEATLLGAVAGTRPWGLTPIPVPGLTKSYVGDLATAVTWLERTGVQVFITDSHEDFFVKNTFVILAEGRSAFPVTNAAAMRELVVTPKA